MSDIPDLDATHEPRDVLARWANEGDEWVRHIARAVLASGRPASADVIESAYALFRQEKALDARELPVEVAIAVEGAVDEAEEPLVITKLSEVAGVNALTPGAVIEPHVGLTILFGENGTGKTGYARVFKSIAGSRTADAILGDISVEKEIPVSAKLAYTLGSTSSEVVWTGEVGRAPFTRISIFDSPAVNFHVDEDLDYVYVPNVLALFNHVGMGIRGVQGLIDAAIAELAPSGSALLSRFPREWDLYPIIETLGASTDLEVLRARIDSAPEPDQRIETLRQTVSALETNALAAQLATRQRLGRVIDQALVAASGLNELKTPYYNAALSRLVELQRDRELFRAQLFAVAALPAEPEETWDAFVTSGAAYQAHLESLDKHPTDTCIYCRQPLSPDAAELIQKYGTYLEDKISDDIRNEQAKVSAFANAVGSLKTNEVVVFTSEYEEREKKPSGFDELAGVATLISSAQTAASAKSSLDVKSLLPLTGWIATLEKQKETVEAAMGTLTDQVANRDETLRQKRIELRDLLAAIELGHSWADIEIRVSNAKQADRLRLLVKTFPSLSRSLTELSKGVSDHLVNENFDKLFIEECEALRAPSLRLEFIGRQGRAQRRKVLHGKHKPSRVLSEGEQKVLAMADFLAEARLSSMLAPVVFDDPVSSLDHRRINEVARRIATLAEETQVIVFTHDVFFAATLLSLFEESKRCTYYQVTDEGGKGRVVAASGPRWDTQASIRKKINELIQVAKSSEGEARAALVQTAYDWIRAWCEVFTEQELLQGVTQRYQPNVRMTTLPKIKTEALPAAIEVVTEVFEAACRYIDGHSQPLATLGVTPTLDGLEAHWKKLQEGKQKYDKA